MRLEDGEGRGVLGGGGVFGWKSGWMVGGIVVIIGRGVEVVLGIVYMVFCRGRGLGWELRCSVFN